MGKTRLIENFSLSKTDLIEIELSETEQKKINESIENGKKLIKVYKFPIWRLDQKNLNGRVYSTALANFVIQNSPITFGLMGHPEDDGNPKDIWAIEKNPCIENGFLWAEFYLIGEYGRLAQEVLELGGSIGLSSSSLGILDEQGNVLIEEFEIERYADWVLSPSYQIYGKKENEIKSEKNLESNTLKTELNINSKINRSEERKMTKLSKIEIKQLKELIEKAEKQSDLKVRMTELQEIASWFDEGYPEDLQKRVENSILETKIELKLEEQKKASENEVLNEAEKKDDSKDKKDDSEKKDTEKDKEKKDSEKDSSDEKEKEPEKKEEAEKKDNSEEDKKDDSEEDKKDDSEKKDDEAEKTKKTESEESSDEDILKRKEESLKYFINRYKKLKSFVEQLKAYSNKQKALLEIQKAKTNGMVEPEKYVELYEAYTKLLNENKELKSLLEEAKRKPIKKEKEDSLVENYFKDLVKEYPYVAEIKESILACENLSEAVKTFAKLRKLAEKKFHATKKISEKVIDTDREVETLNEAEDTSVIGAKMPKDWI